jgi:hypothetical protein
MPTSPPLTQVAAPSSKAVAGPASAAATPPEFVTPLEDDEERLDPAHKESPMRYCSYNNIIDMGQPVPGLVARNLIEELNLASTGEPCSFAEAEQDAAWRVAMKEELHNEGRD